MRDRQFQKNRGARKPGGCGDNEEDRCYRSRVPIVAHSSRTVALPSGRMLAIEEYGALSGPPILFFHGWPSAALQGALLHEAATGLGLRLIAVTRPGLGASAAQPGRRLVDWPPVVRELSTALDLARFHVVGISGGGPYALACAWGLPDAVLSATVICGAPPLAEAGSAQGFNLAYRLMLRIHRHLPWLMRGAFRLLHPFARANPAPWMMVALRGALVGPDRETLADPEISRMCYEGFRGAWGEYRDGVFEDAQLYSHPWGFALEDIRVPVRVWHGTEDRNFSHTLTGYAQRIPRAEVRIIPGEGHYSLPIRRGAEILADLAAASRPV
jgi:pimeloyl-ACP methyl ester carboxylesterase